MFYLAGGFGRYLDIASARRIGLIPDLPDARIRQIGNASIEGATVVLCSVTRRRELEQAVRRIEHVELETAPDFFDRFVEGCLYKPVELAQCVSQTAEPRDRRERRPFISDRELAR
jgi:uncharacterized 2Fe-2S/4Fe-4S cluster protein (DUF4445 family)